MVEGRLKRPAHAARGAAVDRLGSGGRWGFGGGAVGFFLRLHIGVEAGNLVALQEAIDADLDPGELFAFLGRDERVGHPFAAHAPVRPTRCT